MYLEFFFSGIDKGITILHVTFAQTKKHADIFRMVRVLNTLIWLANDDVCILMSGDMSGMSDDHRETCQVNYSTVCKRRARCLAGSIHTIQHAMTGCQWIILRSSHRHCIS